MSTPETPKIETYEELQEWLETHMDTSTESTGKSTDISEGKSTSKKASASSPKKKSSTSKKKKKPLVPDEAITLSEELKENIWSTVHFYTRPGDNIASTRNDAKEEAKFRNDNVLVFYHSHHFGKICDSNCQGV